MIHNKELGDLYRSPGVVTIVRWAGHVARMGETRSA